MILFSEWNTASPHGQTADHVPVHGTSDWKPLVQTLLQPSREGAEGEGAAAYFLELYLVARNSTKGERKQWQNLSVQLPVQSSTTKKKIALMKISGSDELFQVLIGHDIF